MDDRPDLKRTTLRRRRRWPPIVLAVVVALAAVAFFLLRRDATPPRGARPVSTSEPVGEPAASAPAPGPVPQAPAEEARPLLESASANPLYRRALGAGDVPRRVALVVDQLANGDSPRKALAALAPEAPFMTDRREGRAVISPASYARYDAFAAAVASIDVAALANAYRALHGVLETAYRALGHPEGSLDEASARALKRIVDAPVRDGPVEVVPHDGQWLFAERALEEQPEVEKHLLRIGPRNTRILQAKARELEAALRGP